MATDVRLIWTGRVFSFRWVTVLLHSVLLSLCLKNYLK